MWATKEYRHLCEVQQVILTKATAAEITCKDLFLLTRALCILIDTKRVLRMRPRPKDVDVTLEPKHIRMAAAAIEDAPKESLSSQTTPHGTIPEGGNAESPPV